MAEKKIMQDKALAKDTKLIIKNTKIITKDMTINEVLQEFPDAAEVFFNFGFHCLGCAAAHFETIEQGCAVHGIDASKLIDELNKAVNDKLQKNKKHDTGVI